MVSHHGKRQATKKTTMPTVVTGRGNRAKAGLTGWAPAYGCNQTVRNPTSETFYLLHTKQPTFSFPAPLPLPLARGLVPPLTSKSRLAASRSAAGRRQSQCAKPPPEKAETFPEQIIGVGDEGGGGGQRVRKSAGNTHLAGRCNVTSALVPWVQ